jgi:hypothetical protein
MTMTLAASSLLKSVPMKFSLIFRHNDAYWINTLSVAETVR